MSDDIRSAIDEVNSKIDRVSETVRRDIDEAKSEIGAVSETILKWKTGVGVAAFVLTVFGIVGYINLKDISDELELTEEKAAKAHELVEKTKTEIGDYIAEAQPKILERANMAVDQVLTGHQIPSRLSRLENQPATTGRFAVRKFAENAPNGHFVSPKCCVPISNPDSSILLNQPQFFEAKRDGLYYYSISARVCRPGRHPEPPCLSINPETEFINGKLFVVRNGGEDPTDHFVRYHPLSGFAATLTGVVDLKEGDRLRFGVRNATHSQVELPRGEFAIVMLHPGPSGGI